ncbi:hypothetical protein Tco_1055371 [Tanacetum coccineum]|uniref:Uncharacterized protein n=1 Tax=Tanacetum coccineum TaxID=301880 RepID=A0ABQ5H0Q4_9ASTR
MLSQKIISSVPSEFSSHAQKPEIMERKLKVLEGEKSKVLLLCKERGLFLGIAQNKMKDARIEKQKKSVKPTNKNVAEKIKYPEKVHVITDYMIEGTDDEFGMKFEKEEIEKKFIFSYGVRDVTVEAREGNLMIPNVHYTPEAQRRMFTGEWVGKLKWDRNDIQDYVDEEYISWNGSLYALKVNSFARSPKEDVVESSSGNARVKDPQGKEKDDAGIEEALEEDMNKKTQFGVRLEGNMEEEAEESTTDSNDFVVII